MKIPYPFSGNLLKIFMLMLISSFSVTAARSQMRKMYLDDDADAPISKISFYSPAEGYIATYKWIGYTADSGRTFSKKYVTIANVNYGSFTDINVTVGFYIWGIKAFNKNTLLLWGHYGYVPAILYSSDGGNTFKLVFHSQFDPLQLPGGILDIVFPTGSQTGYAVDPDRILKTTDGGQSWTVNRTDPGSFFERLEGVDDNIIFTYSTQTNRMIRTFNAGSTWESVTLPDGGIESAHFRGAGRGWVNIKTSGSGHAVYMTTNSGNGWILQNNPDYVPFSSTRMKFIDNSTGYALSGTYEVWKTYDGGKLWEPLARDNNFSYSYDTHNDLHFWNNNQFWAGGDHGFLEMTSNAGDTTVPQAYFRIDTTGLGLTGTVRLTDYSKPGYQYKWYANNILVGTDYNGTYTHNFSGYLDSVKLVVSNGRYADSLTRYQKFIRPILPLPVSFFPGTGSKGTMITIRGSKFTGVVAVSFGAVAASSFSIASDSVLYAVAGDGASGNIVVSNKDGGSSLPGFTYTPPPSSPAPVINSFSPLSGLVGATVTIQGANFDPSLAGNLVGFGAVNGKIVSATTNQIICTVPPGASSQPLSVTNLVTHLGAIAEKTFGLVFADSGNFTGHSFINSWSVTNNLPQTVLAHDMDGDGKTDIIAVIYASTKYKFVIYRNASVGGNFSFADSVTIGQAPLTYTPAISIQDLDGDGRPDITANTNQDSTVIFRNLSDPGSIVFDKYFVQNIGPNLTTGLASEAMDLDGDGRPDLAIASYTDNTIAILKNTSSPGHLSFGKYIKLPTAGDAESIAVGDLDGDGKKDLATLNYNDLDSTKLTIYRNVSILDSLAFTGRQDFIILGSSLNGRTIRILDFDGDGKSDVVLSTGAGISIYRGTGSPGNMTFAPAVIYPLKWQENEGGWFADLNGDTKPDIISWRNWRNQFKIFRNLSKPAVVSIDTAAVIPTVTPDYLYPVNSQEGDFNLDGKMDIVVSDGNNGKIAVFKNSLGDKVDITTCAGGYETIEADIPGSSFRWQLNTGAGFINLVEGVNYAGVDSSVLQLKNIPLSSDGYTFRCIADGNTSSVFTLHVSAVTLPTVSISNPVTTVCAGVNVSFASAVVNPGKYSEYQWQVNGVNTGTGGVVFSSTTLKDSSKVRLIYIGFDSCNFAHRDTSNTIIMTVNGGIPSVSIIASSSQVCSGSPVTFTAAPVWGGTPGYQWQVNSVNVGPNNAVFTSSALKNGDKIKVVMTADGVCLSAVPVTSNIITMKVNEYLSPSVTIAATQTKICEGDIATFSATALNGGLSPIYQWTINGINAGTGAHLSSPDFKVGDKIQCQLTSSFSCLLAQSVLSNTITLEQGVCIPADNFTLQAFSATCRGKSDGSVSVSTKLNLGYTVSVSAAGGYSATGHFTGTTYHLDGLAPGSYQLCFTADNIPGYQQCFTMAINQPPALRVVPLVQEDQKTITLSLGGSDSYIVTFNGTTLVTGDSLLKLNLREGVNELSVGTPEPCQGSFTAIYIAGSAGANLQVFPNPAHDEVTLYLPGNEDKVFLQLINAASGGYVSQNTVIVSRDRQVHFQTAGLPSGVYIIRVKGVIINEAIKLVKL